MDIATGEGRHKIYPNGDEVYNNTVIYWAPLKNTPNIDISSEDYVDIENEYILSQESSDYQWFMKESIPNDTNDIDLLEKFFNWQKTNQ